MKISELEQVIPVNCIQDLYDDREILGGYTSDLLSDVMAHADEGSVLVTIQAHKNTIAVATVVNIAAIVVCNSRPVPEDMIETARAERLAVFTTTENQFEVSGRLFAALRDTV